MSTQSVDEVSAFNCRTVSMPSGCIEWIGPKHPNGYGRFTFKRKQTLAHRTSYALFKGALKADDCVLHKCDNPSCVNPEHLFVGDRGDNARDMASKGRQWVQKNPAGRPICPIELKPRGSKHGNAKLNEIAVFDIRCRVNRGDLQKHLAIEYGVATTLISQIVKGSIWRHVSGPVKPSQASVKS